MLENSFEAFGIQENLINGFLRVLINVFISFLNIFFMNIFIAKLNYNTDSDGLQEAFEAFGEVSSAKVIFDKFTGKSKGFGFVEMDSDDEAWEAINNLNDSVLDGNTIVVKKAEPRKKPQGRSNFNRNW